MLTRPSLLLALLAVSTLSACSSYMYGYTFDEAMNSYYLVSDEDSFGARRMKYVTGHYFEMKQFVKEHGLPDFAYEEETDEGRDSIRLYYVEKDRVYLFESRGNLLVDVMLFIEQRTLNTREKQKYRELIAEASAPD